MFTILSMLADAGRHFDDRFGDHPEPFTQAHHLMAAAASIAAVFAGVLLCATVVICATLLWRMQRSRHASHRRTGRY
jgi:Flp pilus assembly protein TadB